MGEGDRLVVGANVAPTCVRTLLEHVEMAAVVSGSPRLGISAPNIEPGRAFPRFSCSPGLPNTRVSRQPGKSDSQNSAPVTSCGMPSATRW